jgi:hypothetical protein
MTFYLGFGLFKFALLLPVPIGKRHDGQNDDRYHRGEQIPIDLSFAFGFGFLFHFSSTLKLSSPLLAIGVMFRSRSGGKPAKMGNWPIWGGQALTRQARRWTGPDPPSGYLGANRTPIFLLASGFRPVHFSRRNGYRQRSACSEPQTNKRCNNLSDKPPPFHENPNTKRQCNKTTNSQFHSSLPSILNKLRPVFDSLGQRAQP